VSDPITVKRGDTWKWPFYYYQKEEDGSKSPIDLTACTARLKAAPKNGEPVLYATVAPDPLDEDVNGEVTITPADGLVLVTFLPAVTQGVSPGKYYSDLEMTWADGSVQSSVTFLIIVLEDITV
jgi:hypothetical protein